MPKVWMEAYGCSANLADSEMMAGLLREASYEISGSPEEADLHLIVTCSVKNATAHRMIHRIRELSASRRPVVVAGCLAAAEPGTIERINPRASLLGPRNIHHVVEVVSSTLSGLKAVALTPSSAPKLCLPRVRANPVIGIVEILNGCLSRCAFCQTKLARGDLQSYPPHMILEEVRRSVEEGVKEIWLTSQDNSCYGRDMGLDLADLLERVCRVDGDFMVRVGMMNPLHLDRFLDRLIEAYKHPKIFKFLHIPVESGSDRILHLMRRGYTVDEFLQIVRAFRRNIPDITIATDVIAGFPTETEEDFEDTCRLLLEVRPDVVNISGYSNRPGTPAYSMPQHPPGLIKDRTRRLHVLCQDLMKSRNAAWVGWRGRVLVDEEVKGAVVGRNHAYKPVILRDALPLGSWVEVEVVGCTSSCLYANRLAQRA